MDTAPDDDDNYLPQLSHLDRCSKCPAGWLTVPLLCVASDIPRNINRWYQICFNRLHPSTIVCKGFKWRDDIPQGPASEYTPVTCTGYVCSHGQRRREVKINQECTFGVCQLCCVHIHRTLPGIVVCKCSKHEKAVEYTRDIVLPEADVLPIITYPPNSAPLTTHATASITAPSRSHTAAPLLLTAGPTFSEIDSSPPLPSGASGRGGRGGGTVGGDSSRADPVASSSATADMPSPAYNQQPSYALSISPVYQHRLSEADYEDRRRVEQAVKAKQGHRIADQTIEVFWWYENGLAPRTVKVHVLNPPFFHPRDSTHLVARFNLKAGVFFEYFDWPKLRWSDGSWDSVALNISAVLNGTQELHYRTDGVTYGPGMPGDPPTRKRAAASTENQYGSDVVLLSGPATLTGSTSGSPSKRQRTDPCDIDLTVDDPDVASGPWLPRTPKSARHGTSSDFGVFTSILPSPSDSAVSTPSTVVGPPPSRLSTPSSGASRTMSSHSRSVTPSQSVIEDWLLFGGFDDTPVAGPSLGPSSGLPTAVQCPVAAGPITGPSQELDLDPAPRGPSAGGWPWLYVSDMAAGFRAVEKLQRSGVRLTSAFESAFVGHEFKSSTYSENHKAYKDALSIPGEVPRWEAFGRTKAGLWSEFRKKWGKKH